MHDINNVYMDCLKKLQNVGIKCGNITSVTVNSRIVKRWGQCKRQGNTFTIEISARLIQNGVTLKALEDTLIHEMLHTCSGCFSHGELWQAHANIVNLMYGYNIKRTTSPEEKGLSEDDMYKDAKYHFRCAKCGAEVAQYRASEFTRNPWKYQCAKCGGKFERVF